MQLPTEVYTVFLFFFFWGVGGAHLCNSLNKYIENPLEMPGLYAPYGKPQESVETDLASYTTFSS